jgi:hypothetical protein
MNLTITKLKVTLFFVGLVLCFQLSAQERRAIRGTVKDGSTGESLIGANILIKGTKTGTSTDVSGNFSLNAGSTDVLVVSYVGYDSKEVSVGSQDVVNVSLSGVKALSEVIVTGYSTQSKKNITGAVGTISSKDLLAVP